MRNNSQVSLDGLTITKGIVHIKPAFTSSKLTVETLEQGVKYGNVVFLVSLLLTYHISHLALVFLGDDNWYLIGSLLVVNFPIGIYLQYVKLTIETL